ncbi:DUF6879 family protein [Micromonospora sp. NBC_01796]|uniref:DUF6879 family protein n=1 Tax=Micromonospora sp. NBC_01796 TaxID=2975987 RepID=UPI002DDB0566|nr:DUF6879 family protein [Micromonospora sp. NBC_01796]WSA88363.1 hypothetical protein OIE47_12555 [Micromonospora sp. NBC_01796]
MNQAPTLEELMHSCGRSALHLEMRDGYMRNDPMYTAWQGGHRYKQADRASWWHPWLDLVAQTTRRGVSVRRARVVSEPVSEYIRFEYDVTFRNVAVGEQVRWLPRRSTTDLALPGNDFWLFDGALVLVHHFSGEGDKVGAELVQEPAVVKLCASAFEAVWERATPHDEYQPV